MIDHGEKVEFRLVHDERRFGWVFAKIPKADWGRRILSSLRQAVGMTREEWAAGEITDLVGRRVQARIYHRAGNGKKTFVNVGEFLPAEQVVETATAKPQVERAVAPPTSRPPVKRTATKQVDDASRMPGDDIPF